MSDYPDGYMDVPYGEGPGKCSGLFCPNDDCRCLCHYPERRWDKPEGNCERHGQPIVRVESWAGKKVQFCETCMDEAVEQKWLALELEARAETEADGESQPD